MLDDTAVSPWALPELTVRELRQVGGGVPVSDAATVWIDVGATLTVCGFLPLPGTLRHVRVDSACGLAAVDAMEPDEAMLLGRLTPGREATTANDLLCDAGLVRLYRETCRLRRVPAQQLRPEAIAANALAARCPECSRALTIFCALLGDLAARAALALAARGGVYVGGTLLAPLDDWFTRSPFRRRFDNRGRDRTLLPSIPTWLVRSVAL